MSSWEAHQHRNPRSTEPGTDFYCPIGTPVYAPEDGRVYGWGDSIIPDTGRWVGLDLTTGQRFRAMHFSRIVLSRSVLANRGYVRRGQLIAYSGATGYGDNDWSDNPNTGGAHTHVTLWPTQVTRFGYHWVNGKEVPYTVDFMNYVGKPSGGGGNTPKPEPVWRKNSMSTIYRKQEGSTFTYALAGDSPGTSANWLETTDDNLAKQWGEVHGRSVFLNPNTSWKTYKAAYLEALRTR